MAERPSAGAGDPAADDNFAITLHCYRPNRAAGAWVRVKPCVEPACRIDPRDAAAVRPIKRSEESSGVDFSIRLRAQSEDEVAWSGAGSKSRIHTAICIEPGEVAARRGIDGREVATDDDLSVRLQNHRNDPAAWSRRTEGTIQSARWIEASDKIVHIKCHVRKVTTNQYLRVRLDSNRLDGAVDIVGNETQIDGAVGIQDDKVVDELSVETVKAATENDAAIGQECEAID